MNIPQPHPSALRQPVPSVLLPALADLSVSPSSPGSTVREVGRRLAIIGDDINERYDAEFHGMLKSLQPTPENAYDYFKRIASR